MREAAAVAGDSREWRGAATATTAANQAADERVATARSGPVGEDIEETQASAMPITTTLARAARTSAEANVAKRQAQARAIVARHAAYSAVGGIVPLPVASVAVLPDRLDLRIPDAADGCTEWRIVPGSTTLVKETVSSQKRDSQ